MVVPAGTQHQFVNTGPTPLVYRLPLSYLSLFFSHLKKAETDSIDFQILYTIYSPAEHNPQTVHQTKEEGDEEEENGKDEAPDWSRKPKTENEKNGLVNTSGKY